MLRKFIETDPIGPFSPSICVFRFPSSIPCLKYKVVDGNWYNNDWYK